MKLIHDGIRMELTIDSYEFPYYEHNTYDDNNWLNIKVEWEDDVIAEEGISPSITTRELKQLYEGISKVLSGVAYHSNFKEEDLKIDAQKVNDHVNIQMSYAKPGHNRLGVEAQLSLAQLDEIITDLHELCMAFPERKKTILH